MNYRCVIFNAFKLQNIKSSDQFFYLVMRKLASVYLLNSFGDQRIHKLYQS
jgi:hypothetical protein